MKTCALGPDLPPGSRRERVGLARAQDSQQPARRPAATRCPGGSTPAAESLAGLAAQAAAPAGAEQGGASEERLGPFSIAGRDYSVLLRKKKRRPGSTQESGETVVAMEIQDATGAILYQRTFPYQEETEDFSDAWFVSAGLLTGANGSGLLVNFSEDSEPSAPEPEPTESWQVFGVVNGKAQTLQRTHFSSGRLGTERR